MNVINSIEQLKGLLVCIHNLKRGLFTNFYLNEKKHSAWIRTGRFFYEQFDDTVFLVFNHRDNSFLNLYFISVSVESVLSKLENFKNKFPKQTFYLDVVGRKVASIPIVDKLSKIGAREGTVLRRMVRIGKPNQGFAQKCEDVEYVSVHNIIEIDELLHTFFDERFEQLPLFEELEEMAREKRLLRLVRDNQTAGILVFDLTPSTLFLRYWLTLPAFRNQGVGGGLLKHFFWEGRETNRQILWVMHNNENAIKRYEHYGFNDDNMNDYIMYL